MSLLLLFNQAATQAITGVGDIPSGEDFGLLKLMPIIRLASIESEESFGLPSIAIVNRIELLSIESEEDFGLLSLGQQINLTSIESAEDFGLLTIERGRNVHELGIHTTDIIAEEKDGFLWGASPISFSEADDEVNITPHHTDNDFYIGRRHQYFDLPSFTESWDRIRSYVSFNTSGLSSSYGHLRDVKLKLYIVDAYSNLQPNNGLPSFSNGWQLDIYTVSGTLNRNVPYTSSYGFGDVVDYTGDWGAQPNSLLNSLNERANHTDFTTMSNSALSTNQFRDINNRVYRFTTTWVDINIPVEFINFEGETHFRLVHRDEAASISTTGGAYDHDEFVIYSSANSLTNKPILELNYVEYKTDFHIGFLRAIDLSVNKNLQEIIDLTTLSGLAVSDGYLEIDSNVKTGRAVSLEHIHTSSQPLELSSRKTLDRRRFAIDIIANKKGELRDLVQQVTDMIAFKTFNIYDFNYGFINPPVGGKMTFDSCQVFQTENHTFNDESFYHSTIIVSCESTSE